ncbi:tyrosine recombinase XerD [Geobacter sp. OR-1]|uniref:tyrosine-type recombinase/integrase n=1 Tax=Geobacter sp. OR-1 TaxID=1266765 RepID=UPI000541B9E9|nr:tyrosine-type recombinase/integrase [Geobacter sp. OR-1]GAM09046.1 tyrosine recombinase XerD [Geobacter sp. OR-1]
MGKRKLFLLGQTALQQKDDLFVLPDRDLDLYLRIIEAFTNKHYSLNHQEKSVNRDLAVIQDMLTFARKSPWQWTEEDFERWGADIGRNRKLATATQRHYQGVIRGFLKYIVENIRFSEEIYRQFGIRIRQICTEENCIPHVHDRELKKERPAIPREEVDLIFATFDRAISECASFSSKDLRPLQRDKTMFFSVYSLGARASETIGLNINSFVKNPGCPQFGEFGIVSVYGKGSKGSGPKHRYIPVIQPEFVDLIAWYIKSIRPLFLMNADPNEQALFLSERGRRLSLSAFEERFQHIMRLSGLKERGYTPHCLRHSSVTDKKEHLSIDTIRRMHGHVFEATTQGYTHIPDSDVEREIKRCQQNLIKRIQEKENV